MELENRKTNVLQKPSKDLLQYYKNKTCRLEKEIDSLSELLDNIRSACDLSNDLQSELNVRNEEVSRLQQVVSDLQIHLFKEREHCLRLSAENDRLRIQEFEDRKKINILLMHAGAPNAEVLNLISTTSKGVFIEKKLPPKLNKLKDMKAKKLLLNHETANEYISGSDKVDIQSIILQNHSLAAQLEHHISISRDQIQVLLKDRELAQEEREIEKKRLQKEINFLSSKLKEIQDYLHETSTKLVKCQKNFEREKDEWMEEKEKYNRILKLLGEENGEQYVDVIGNSVNGLGLRKRNFSETEVMKEQILEKEQLVASYQEHIISMEAEITNLRERAHLCRKAFKEKMDKMSSQTIYLKKKYEDLDRRRQLEAEGFRTDIKMLRERLKELEKKLTKVNIANNSQPVEQQLLTSARNTLNRARQLEKELINIKSKIVGKDGDES